MQLKFQINFSNTIKQQKIHSDLQQKRPNNNNANSKMR